MRIVFIGSPPFAREAFDRILRRSERPVGLITAPERTAGRGRKPAPNSLAVRAREEGIPVLQPERASSPECLADFAALRPDLGVVVSYGQILSPEFLRIPEHGCVNLHGSLLPRWRGASPVHAALLAGDTVTGVSLQRVVAELDAGPVLASRALPVGSRETTPELMERVAQAGGALLAEFLNEVGEGPLPPGTAQDDSQVTLCRKIRRDAGRIDWSRSAAEVDRLVRAMVGWPVADTLLPDGGVLKILAGEPVGPSVARGAPGEVLEAGPGLVVRCGEDAYRIAQVQRAGKTALDAASFLRGFRLEPGARLGPGRRAESGG